MGTFSVSGRPRLLRRTFFSFPPFFSFGPCTEEEISNQHESMRPGFEMGSEIKLLKPNPVYTTALHVHAVSRMDLIHWMQCVLRMKGASTVLLTTLSCAEAASGMLPLHTQRSQSLLQD